MNNKYSDTTLSNDAPFANLPVESFNKITWRGGDDKLSALLSTDPGLYLGEFRSMVKTTGTPEKPSITFPVLPWRVVTRRSGRETYQRYSATEMRFRPIAARSRFVKYERTPDGKNRVKGENGRNKITAVAKAFPGKGSGFEPHKEVFGYVLDDNNNIVTHACLVLDNWSSYLSYNAAAKKFEGLKVQENHLVVFVLGTRGEVVNGEVVQKQKTFNGAGFVDIEALDLHKPSYIEITKDFDDLWEAAQEWAKCPRWHAETAHAPESVVEVAQELGGEVSDIPADEVYP